MVPLLSIVFIIVSGLICAGVPVGGLVWLSTRRHPDRTPRYPDVWRPFVCGALAFTMAQLLTRIPLHVLVLPRMGAVGEVLLSLPVASFTAGLFEETGRLVVMVLLLKGFHRWIDGVSFGLGHGGIEAILLVGLTQLNNLILALAINTGQWQVLTGSMPAGTADPIRTALVDTPSALFGVGGIERISAISLHIGCSLIVLWGVHTSRKAIAWLVAVVLHGLTNLSAMLMVAVPGMSGVAATEGVLLIIAMAIWAVAWRVRPSYAARIEASCAARPAPDRAPPDSAGSSPGS